MIALAMLAWSFQIRTDPMTDTEMAIVATLDTQEKFAVSLRCEDKGTGNILLFAKSSAYLGGKGGLQNARNIQYRIDDGMSSLLTGVYRSDEVAVAPSYELGRFMKAAAGAKSRIIMRFETYSGEYLDAFLPVSGAAQAISKIRDFCETP